MNVLCLVDQDRQRLVIVEYHTSMFKAIQTRVSLPLIGQNTKNGATLPEFANGDLNHKFQEKVEDIIVVGN